MLANPITARGKALSLDTVPTLPRKRNGRERIERDLEELSVELAELQELLWGARTHSVLVVLQGRDASGKDGAIKRVAGAFNPRGMSVVSFGVPTQEEREHDFLWRVHRHAPRCGEVAIWNRSHYEDVLVPRVRGEIDQAACRARFGHIVDFEALLAARGCIVLKFFLHVSKAEQRRRLLAREQEPEKAWKVDPNDWKERRHWGAYTRAYEAAIRHTASAAAPWYVVPADSKPYRNLCVADAVARAMRPYARSWRRTLLERARAR